MGQDNYTDKVDTNLPPLGWGGVCGVCGVGYSMQQEVKEISYTRLAARQLMLLFECRNVRNKRLMLIGTF